MVDRSSAGILEQMEHWGYYLLPPTYAESPGYTGLLVALREHPTLKHFDPESLSIPLVRPDGRIEETRMTLEHPSAAARVCIGPVALTDRKNKQERFFTYGGTLESTSVPGETVYSLRSSAPILWLSAQGTCGGDHLASETGLLLAETRAGFGEREDEFYRRLSSLEPLALYVACLYSIFEDYEHSPDLRDSFPECHMLLHKEKRWLERVGLWTSEPISLSDLVVNARSSASVGYSGRAGH
ncbi:MAG: hypothetical protein ACM3JD_13105 [Rudaea sp.]